MQKMEINHTLLGIMNITAFPLPPDEVFPIRPWILISYCIISGTGIVGNLFVVLVVSGHKTMGAASFRIYIGALAITDLLVTLFCIPIYITSTAEFRYHPTGMMGDITCKLLSGYTLPFYLASVSTYIMVAISLQRFFAICKPLSSMANPSSRTAKIVVCIIWLGPILLAIYPMMGLEYVEERKATIGAHCQFLAVFSSNKTPKVLYVLTTTVQFIIPVGVMFICFIQIKRKITQKISKIKLHEVSTCTMELKSACVKRKTVMTVFIVIFSFIILLTPNQLMYFCFSFSLYQTSWHSDIYQSTIVLYFFTSCINPVIYAFRSKPFRDGLKRTLKNYFGELQSRSQSGTSPETISSTHNNYQHNPKQLK